MSVFVRTCVRRDCKVCENVFICVRTCEGACVRACMRLRMHVCVSLNVEQLSLMQHLSPPEFVVTNS